MPKVLTKLRVDEVSCVTKGAGEGTRIVLMKRDAPRPKAFGYAMPKREPRNVYHEIFARKRVRHGRAAATHLTKHEEPNMDRMTKNVRSMGEHEYTRILADYAKQQYPDLARECAFSKVFTEDSDEGRAIRKFWQISKGDEIVGGEIDDPVGERDDEDDDTDALEELEEQAREERRRNPKLSKAQAFTKIYTDPSNAALVRRERMQNRPR